MTFQRFKKTNVVATNEQIDALLKPLQEMEWFFDFIETSNFIDLYSDYEDYDDELDFHIEEGIKLAQRAGNRPIWKYYEEDYGATYYLIGTEKEVIQKIKKEISSWLEKHPQKSLEQIKQEQIKQSIKAVKQNLKHSQKELNRLQKLERENL